MKLGAHFLHAFFVTLFHVVFFAEVVFEIIEMNSPVFVSFHQFPVAHSNSARGEAALIAVVGIVPVKGVTIEVSPLEKGKEVDAI